MKSLITNLPMVFVKPGEFHFSKDPELVVTILGSCVAIIMYDIEKGICTMSHCVLPVCSSYSNEEDKCKFKYVDTAIKKMMQIFNANKIPTSKIMVKLFGGAEQLANGNRKNHSIGKQNIIKALEILEQEKLNIVAMDVGGNTGRKIYISSHTGEVLLSRLGSIKIVGLEQLK